MSEQELHPIDFDEPIVMFGTDPQDAKDIAEMERAVAKEFNEGFLTRPDIILDKFYVNGGDHEHVSYVDILSPGNYWGDDVRSWYNFISPQFVAEFDLRNLRIFARNGVGFVFMHQIYEGTLPDGSELVWKMRQTDAIEKIDGQWKILHTHLSFAVDPQDLNPANWIVDKPMKKRPNPWTVETPYTMND